MKRIRIPLLYKRIWNYFGAFFFATIVFIVGYNMISKGNIKLTDLDTFTGIITNKGITENKSSIAGKSSMSSNVFFFKIKGLKQTLALHKSSQDYTALDKNISKNDIVTAYFLKSNDSLRLNLDVYQLEKDGIIIQHIDKYVEKESGIGYLVFTMGFVFIGMGAYQDKKYWKRTNNEK